MEIPVFVLDDRRRILNKTGATAVLAGRKGGGNLESYVQVKALEAYMPASLRNRMIDFIVPGDANKADKGVIAETFLEICAAYVRAWRDGVIETDSEVAIAKNSAVFLTTCSKVGLIALIDEATSYEYRRVEEEIQLKLRVLLLEEMQKWERIFPDELWEQFGRLTNWKGSVHQRPQYWGKLLMDLIYEYLDPDVVEWLRENAPTSRHGQSYHQWLTSQYGLEKLIEHTWKVIGVASTCDDGRLADLQDKMKKLFGEKRGFQHALRLVPAERNFASE